MPRVQTVLGNIAPEEMGVTYHHEHIFSSPPKRITDKDPDLVLDSVDLIVQELELFRKVGGKTAVSYTHLTLPTNREV